MPSLPARPSRRRVLTMIGQSAGASAMYAAMRGLALAGESSYRGALQLSPAKPGTHVVILGAGVAGLLAAQELKRAGYRITVLEFQKRIGGRALTLRGGDVVHEMGGGSYTVGFSRGQYFNPGPWRIPHNHHGILDTCRRFGVALEPVVQRNENAYLHTEKAFGGRPIRFREINTDYQGGIAELLAKATEQGRLDAAITGDEQAALLDSLRAWGLLDGDLRYREGMTTADYRGYRRAPGGGAGASPIASRPISLDDVLRSGLWEHLRMHDDILHQSPMFQPVGGMDQLTEGLKQGLETQITLNAQVARIAQSVDGVTVDYAPADGSGDRGTVKADYCLCTIPFTVLSQMQVDLGSGIMNAVRQVSYTSSFKAGFEMKERFWETEEQIYGGVSFTDLPIVQIGYPSHDMLRPGPGILMAAYMHGSRAFQFNSLTPEERVRRVLDWGTRIHPRMKDAFVTGVGYAWHRNRWILGCRASWQDRSGYEEAVAMDRRVVCAGEHLSYLNGWLEGSVLSSQHATRQLHQQAINA